MKNYIGIDVAKTTLAVAIPTTTGGWTNTTVSNTPEGIHSLLNQLPSEAHCILEATAGPPGRFLFRFSDLHALPG
jgi:transposase